MRPRKENKNVWFDYGALLWGASILIELASGGFDWIGVGKAVVLLTIGCSIQLIELVIIAKKS